jgi:hypothetical protein
VLPVFASPDSPLRRPLQTAQGEPLALAGP